MDVMTAVVIGVAAAGSLAGFLVLAVVRANGEQRRLDGFKQLAAQRGAQFNPLGSGAFQEWQSLPEILPVRNPSMREWLSLERDGTTVRLLDVTQSGADEPVVRHTRCVAQRLSRNSPHWYSGPPAPFSTVPQLPLPSAQVKPEVQAVLRPLAASGVRIESVGALLAPRRSGLLDAAAAGALVDAAFAILTAEGP